MVRVRNRTAKKRIWRMVRMVAAAHNPLIRQQIHRLFVAYPCPVQGIVFIRLA